MHERSLITELALQVDKLELIYGRKIPDPVTVEQIKQFQANNPEMIHAIVIFNFLN